MTIFYSVGKEERKDKDRQCWWNFVMFCYQVIKELIAVTAGLFPNEYNVLSTYPYNI